MISHKQICHIGKIVKKYRPDQAKIRYYPFCHTHSEIVTNVGTTKNKSSCVKLSKYLENNGIVKSKMYTEHSIKDTYMRSCKDAPTIYFRKKCFSFHSENIDGLFVVEIYHICEENDFPHIVNYDHRSAHVITTHDLNHVMFSHNVCNKSEFFDISADLNIDDVEVSMICFADSVNLLKDHGVFEI